MLPPRGREEGRGLGIGGVCCPLSGFTEQLVQVLSAHECLWCLWGGSMAGEAMPMRAASQAGEKGQPSLLPGAHTKHAGPREGALEGLAEGGASRGRAGAEARSCGHCCHPRP